MFYCFIKCWLYFLEWGVAQKSWYMVNIQSIYGALSAFKSWKTINNLSETLDPNTPIFQNYINLHKLQMVWHHLQQKLQTTLHQRTNTIIITHNYLHANSKHSYSLKKSIPYNQALWIKRICSTFQEYVKHSGALIEKFVEKGYHEKTIKIQIERANHLERSSLLNKTQSPKNLSLSVI